MNGYDLSQGVVGQIAKLIAFAFAAGAFIGVLVGVTVWWLS